MSARAARNCFFKLVEAAAPGPRLQPGDTRAASQGQRLCSPLLRFELSLPCCRLESRSDGSDCEDWPMPLEEPCRPSRSMPCSDWPDREPPPCCPPRPP